MTGSNPRPGEQFRLTDDPNEQVTVIQSNNDEVRIEKADGTKETLARSTFIRDYVLMGTHQQGGVQK